MSGSPHSVRTEVFLSPTVPYPLLSTVGISKHQKALQSTGSKELALHVGPMLGSAGKTKKMDACLPPADILRNWPGVGPGQSSPVMPKCRQVENVL